MLGFMQNPTATSTMEPLPEGVPVETEASALPNVHVQTQHPEFPPSLQLRPRSVRHGSRGKGSVHPKRKAC